MNLGIMPRFHFPLFLQISALVLLGLRPTGARAGFDEDTRYYQLDSIEVPAPGADSPDQRLAISEFDYYRWALRTTPNPAQFSPDEYADGTVAEYVDDLFESYAHEEAGTTPESVLSDQSARTIYETTLRTLVQAELAQTAAGAFQPYVWQWYQKQTAFEKEHAERVDALKAEQEKWELDWVAEQRFNKYIEAEKINDRYLLGYATARLEMLERVRSNSGDNPSLKLGQLIWQNRELEAKFIEYRDEWMESFRSDPSLSSEDLGLAKAAFVEELSILETNDFFPPSIVRQLDRARSENGSEKVFWFNLTDAYLQTLELENNPELGMAKDSTMAWDSYAIIEAPIDDVLDAYLYRHGHPIAQELPAVGPFVFPSDELFQFRRDQAFEQSAIWGPNTWLSHTVKWQAKTSFVANLSDAFAGILRGNSKDGYEVIGQFMGGFCPESEELSVEACSTKTKSSMSILILKPISPTKTAYKLTARHVGQDQTVAKNRQGEEDSSWGDWFKEKALKATKAIMSDIVAEFSREEIGFNIKNFEIAQVNFHNQVKRLSEGRKKIAAAEEAGKPIELLDSSMGYYFFHDELVKVDTVPELAKSEYVSISKFQGIYLVDGEIVRLAEERASDYFGPRPFNAWKLNEVR